MQNLQRRRNAQLLCDTHGVRKKQRKFVDFQKQKQAFFVRSEVGSRKLGEEKVQQFDLEKAQKRFGQRLNSKTKGGKKESAWRGVKKYC